jgi:hypothetical protein
MDVNIPQIIIGEAFAIITRKSSTDDLKEKIFDLVELIKTLVSDTGSCIPPVNQETINMAKEIKVDDSFVDWTDAVFISHAIVDRGARIVFTTDTNIQHSRAIYDKIKNRKEDFGATLKIMDSVP